MTEILGLRRQSTGNEVINSIKIKNNNYRSFTQSAHQSIEMCEQFNSFKEENKIIKNNKNTSSLPQIEINGVNQEKEINEEKQNNSDIQQNTEINLEINSLNNQKGEGEYSSAIPLYFKHKAQKVDSRKIAAKKRLERGQTTSGSDNSSQNAKKVIIAIGWRSCPINSSFSERTLAKSLDNKHTDNTFLFDLKPLQSNIKCSPNHHSQQRLGSVGNVFGLINLNNRLFSSNIEINILNFELFGISPNISIFELDESQWDQHPFSRHVRIFNNILDLSVRNSAELEKEMLPVLFAYGQRHYRANIKDHFNEKSVRLFCSQIIGTLCDLLDKKLNLFAQEAWIEMVTYLGRALLSGFEHERQKRKKFPLPKNY
uniref:GLOBIN domain-containing protein n=1 Tax=Meloidogyne incognita TaxID=6306 RepID=A0A914N4V0_MELIC